MLGGYTALTICFCCPSLPIQRPEDSLSTWSWSSTHREAKANHNYETEWDIFVNTDMRWRCNSVFLIKVKRSSIFKMVFRNSLIICFISKWKCLPLWWQYSAQETGVPPPFWSRLWWSQLLHFWWLWTRHLKGAPKSNKLFLEILLSMQYYTRNAKDQNLFANQTSGPLKQKKKTDEELTAAMSFTSFMMISAIWGGVEPFIHQWLSPLRM